MADIIQIRRGTAADATSNNITLASGEIGYETDTGKMKIGDGTTAWTSLSYYSSTVGNATAISIIDSEDYFSGTNVETALAELGRIKQWRNGFDLQTPASLPDISWNNSTRTVSFSVKSGSSNFYFWASGKVFVKTTTQSVVIPTGTSTTYYVYFDNSGTVQYIAQSSIVAAVFYQHAIGSFVQWNNIDSVGVAYKELHGVRMSSTTHDKEHHTVGAAYGGGFDVDGLVSGNTTFSQVGSGIFWDEDIKHEIAANSTAIKTLYRKGSGGIWTYLPGDLAVAYKDGTDTYYSWNKDTGGTWEMEQGGSTTDFWITFFAAQPTVDSDKEIVKIMGQEAFKNVGLARTSIETAMRSLQLDGLPTPEMRFIGAVIVKRNGDLQTMADGTVFYDLRLLNGSGAGSNPSTNAEDIIVDTTDFDKNFDSSDDNVQKALQHVNDHNIVGYYDADITIGNYLYFNTTDGRANSHTPAEVKSNLSLNNVENTAISTWTGSTYITTVGTIATGTWQGTDIADGYIANAAKYKKQVVSIAVSDESSDLTTGTGKTTFRMPFALTLTDIRASVTTAPTGSTLIVDVNESGTTILSTKISIDASEKTSETAATPPVISDTALADDAEITIDIDQIGSTVAGKGLKIYLIGTI